ncbi:MAG: chorismate mutase [Kiritimatiellae bacterium]|nr:chorismate mutase [Kiritimatiellia bacterium]MCO5061247.1 chorismate mutase [Kiritimatiellia bacterium]
MAKRTDSAVARLASLRARIDALDGRLVALLNQRSRLAQAIGELKSAQGAPLFVPEREQQVLAGLSKRNGGPLSQHSLAAIYREIISAALSLEGGLKIGVVDVANGAIGLAARDRFGASARYERARSAPVAVRGLLDGRWHALCVAESALKSARRAIEDGLLRVSKVPGSRCVVLVRGGG